MTLKGTTKKEYVDRDSNRTKHSVSGSLQYPGEEKEPEPEKLTQQLPKSKVCGILDVKWKKRGEWVKSESGRPYQMLLVDQNG